MKKISVLITALIAGVIVLNVDIKQGHGNPSGAPSGSSGSPFDGGLANGTCMQSGCHSGTPVEQAGMITSDVPNTGYVPGQTYTITATITAANKVRFGFEISPQNSSGALQGQLVVTNSTETKLVGSSKYITHKTAGNSGSGSRTWTFNWIAPAAGTGDVTFYGSLMAANNNGGDSGDNVYFSTLTVSEASGAGVAETGKAAGITLFPNPSNGNFTIATKGINGVVDIKVYAIDGKLVYSSSDKNENSKFNLNLNSQLQAGMYLAVVKADGVEKTMKFVVE